MQIVGRKTSSKRANRVCPVHEAKPSTQINIEATCQWEGTAWSRAGYSRPFRFLLGLICHKRARSWARMIVLAIFAIVMYFCGVAAQRSSNFRTKLCDRTCRPDCGTLRTKCEERQWRRVRMGHSLWRIGTQRFTVADVPVEAQLGLRTLKHDGEQVPQNWVQIAAPYLR
jgi:hypothetical protein